MLREVRQAKKRSSSPEVEACGSPGCLVAQGESRHEPSSRVKKIGSTAALENVLEAVSDGGTIPDLLHRTFASLKALTGATSYAIWLTCETLSQPVLAYAAVNDDLPSVADRWTVLSQGATQSFLREVTRLGTPMLIADMSTDERVSADFADLFGQSAMMVLPFLVQGRLRGVFAMAGPRDAGLMDLSNLSGCQSIINVLALAIENARLSEREALAQRTKEEFISLVSHELKTPLTSISGYVQLLTKRMSGAGDASLQNYLGVISEKTRYLTQLINNLLDFRRDDQLVPTVARECVDLAEIVRCSVSSVRMSISEHEFDLVLPPHLSLWGDPYRLRQVIDQLLYNAVKYSLKGGTVRLQLRLTDLESKDGKRQQAVLSIADDGAGISPLHLPHVFERFYQADLAGGEALGGLGLGLSICQRIIEEHGGRIWMESKAGEGTTFSFSLPVEAHRPSESHMS